MLKYSIDSENSVIASCLDNNKIICDILMIIENKHFDSKNKAIFEIIEEFYSQGILIDIFILFTELEKRNITYEKAELSQMMLYVTTKENVKYHARVIKDLYLRRKLNEKLSETLEKVYTEDADVLLDSINSEFEDEFRQQTIMKHYKELHQDFCENYITRKEIKSITTGFQKLDDILAGYEAGSLNIIAARPSAGKTAFALNIVLNNLRFQKHIYFYSLEMTNIELLNRLISNYSNLLFYKLRKKKLDAEEELSLYKNLEAFSEYNLSINDKSHISIKDIYTEMRILQKTKPIDLIVVDYLQLINPENAKETRNNQVAQISRQLKIMAKEFNCPVIALSQLSRQKDNQNKEPSLQDLRDSGAIEQDADSVLFLHRENNDEILTKIVVGKNRNGYIGRSEISFNGDYQKFFEE